MSAQSYAKLILLVLLLSCKADVDLVAPEARERVVVYGILRTDRDTQYIRVGRLFVTREDAAAYAARADLSVQARVVLTDGQREWVATPETVVKVPDQPFFPVQVVYQLAMRPVPRTSYQLRVSVPERPDLSVSAEVVVPSPPYIARPETIIYLGGQPAYPGLDLTKRYVIQFFPQANIQIPSLAGGYELTFRFVYAEVRGRDTIPRELVIGPRRLPAQGSGIQTYTLQEKELLRTAYANLSDPTASYTYDNRLLSQAWSLSLTALDTALYHYLRINDPATTDFTTVKPEYTNIQNGLGIFGAAAIAHRYFRIDSCSEYLLRLNEAPAPLTPCSLD